ncbi:Crp/Fnr family transcriptional regulator [Colwellia piezophila]|uniref:Crp/Fnr family transcriptional regulator n=1 Tax=Colwellia piezophila TaxID=211668 RepID=UPI00037854B4|nr:Crp/Fnr family transcriptional regulator [Colwellia piezophila]
MSSINLLINSCAWFDDVPEEGRETIIKSARLKHYDNKKYLYRLAQESDFVYAVVSGFVRIKISSIGGQEFSITEFSANEWLGELALTNQPTQMFEAQVLENSSIIEIPKRVVQAVADKYPVIYKNLFLFQANRTLKMSELLGGMLFYPLAARLAGRILWFARHYGKETENGVLINKKMSQQELAELTMGSRQRINKTLKEWERAGILAIQGQQYFIKDIPALRKKTQIKND